jgi:nucleoside-triphosphatase THEP1
MPTAEKPWLGLVGEPGASKTRCAYLRLRQLGEEWTRKHGRPPKFEIVTGPEFKRYALDRFSKEKVQSTGWMATGTTPVSEIASASLREIKNADVLLFDELGEKIKATPAVIEELFGLIDYRHSENLVTIWTCNSSPEEFCGDWPPEFAGPIAGRVVETSTIFKV